MASPLEIVQEWKARMRARDFEQMADVVDLEGYTENCLGLTEWTTGYEVALNNYIKNMVEPWSEMKITEEETIADGNAVVTRLHTGLTHILAVGWIWWKSFAATLKEESSRNPGKRVLSPAQECGAKLPLSTENALHTVPALLLLLHLSGSCVSLTPLAAFNQN